MVWNSDKAPMSAQKNQRIIKDYIKTLFDISCNVYNINKAYVGLRIIFSDTIGKNGRTAGICSKTKYGNTFTITLNSTILDMVGIERFKNTGSHELAHVITCLLYPTVVDDHGKEFIKIHTELGGDGKQKHNYFKVGI